MEHLRKSIKLLLTDVDGVLTDGGIYYGIGDFSEMKRFHVRDGYICKKLHNSGIKLGIITGRTSLIVQRRATELNFNYLFQGVENKIEIARKIALEENISLQDIAYIGDDLNDLDLLQNVGLSATPGDSIDYIKNNVDYVCKNYGGNGAFREFADYLLQTNV
jgi:YrbI family 3-deoxy-D-manno-octulosonate 8-phosphate phosphatase